MAEDTEFPPLPAAVIRAMPSFKTVDAVLDSLTKHMAKVEADAKRMGRLDIAEAARIFICMHRINAQIDLMTKAWNAIYEQVKTRVVPEMLEAEGKTSENLEGFRITTSSKLYASIAGGKKDDAYKWLRENGLGALITETVNASTLSAAAKVRLEEEFLDLPSDLFNTTVQSNTSVTRTKR